MNIDRKLAFLQEQGKFGPNFRYKGSSPTNHSSCWKTRLMHFLYMCGIRISVDVSVVSSQSMHLTDGWRDRRTEI